MALIIEDGSAKDDATTYIDVDECIQHLKLFGYCNSGFPTLQTEEQERLLEVAAITLDAIYNWKGSLVADDQALMFPRAKLFARGVEVGSTSVPVQIRQAQALIAEVIRLKGPSFNPTEIKADPKSDDVIMGKVRRHTVFAGDKESAYNKLRLVEREMPQLRLLIKPFVTARGPMAVLRTILS